MLALDPKNAKVMMSHEEEKANTAELKRLWEQREG